jgi:hypothetical protein
MRDYTVFYRNRLATVGELNAYQWDRLISACDGSERVHAVFSAVHASEKHWLNFPEYGLATNDIPAGCHTAPGNDEADAISSYFAGKPLIQGSRICVDITGFLRPHLVFLVRYLAQHGVRKFDAIYAEPSHYAQKVETVFAHENILSVRQVAGCEGLHSISFAADALIMAVGYEHHLVTRVAEQKAHARKLRVLGFPSLQADMYQESIVRQSRAAEAVGEAVETMYAPAYDPFVLATAISERVATLEAGGLTNLYLSPLSTKPHALGFALFYVYERLRTATSIIYPFAESHAQQTSRGLARIWRYEVELP